MNTFKERLDKNKLVNKIKERKSMNNRFDYVKYDAKAELQQTEIKLRKHVNV